MIGVTVRNKRTVAAALWRTLIYKILLSFIMGSWNKRPRARIGLTRSTVLVLSQLSPSPSVSLLHLSITAFIFGEVARDDTSALMALLGQTETQGVHPWGS